MAASKSVIRNAFERIVGKNLSDEELEEAMGDPYLLAQAEEIMSARRAMGSLEGRIMAGQDWQRKASEMKDRGKMTGLQSIDYMRMRSPTSRS
jgi:hypothetical protein